MEPNFVIVKSPDPLDILAGTFPELRNLLEDAEYGTYYVYERFSEHLSSHPDDDQLWKRAYEFFETLATGSGSLQDLLALGVFEPLCEDASLLQKLKKGVGPAALKLLRKMGQV